MSAALPLDHCLRRYSQVHLRRGEATETENHVRERLSAQHYACADPPVMRVKNKKRTRHLAPPDSSSNEPSVGLLWGSWVKLDGVACGHLGSWRLPSSASVFVPTHVALSRFGYVYTSSVGRNGADQHFCRLRRLFLSVMPFIGCLFPLIHRSRAQHGFCLLVRCNVEGDHIDSMTALIDAEVALARPGKAVHDDENSCGGLRCAS